MQKKVTAILFLHIKTFFQDYSEKKGDIMDFLINKKLKIFITLMETG
ncbi:virulence genes transcriptional activator SpvR, partial [Salmonella enterica subsp. enterica serovar Dublin]|nr:virulence genes transcriptional activator SpvR [Salmonella enterica]EBZ7048203.1 virulence genes transcriptional activator SpvR [Salmonella enterica subsp. enterica serovar Dublin]EDJ8414904.1 virulence genes transcriptional activator SpvR [Salmonella enterica subsp. enterica serovar Dublin]EDZ2905294.1 virulence genes transcriptional activator SpvR [Salmonella enterica subsp. enterica serovar Dublin]